ncbi:MAG: hypothetical protein CMP51_01850 [Flavobacteriales bacterium]|nr:hypothetical protein [Flavobacteriales bacterium]
MSIRSKYAIFIILFIAMISCNEENIIGDELNTEIYKIHVSSDSITSLSIFTISEDSLRSDETLNLLLGEINDPQFGQNSGSFITQMTLPSNNIQEISNIVIDSVFIQYTYSELYGEDASPNNFQISVYELSESVYKDSSYYSNYNPAYNNENIAVEHYFVDQDTSESILKVKLLNSFGEKIMNATGTASMVDNLAFLEFLKGLYITASSNNTIMYLNPNADNSRFSIYYHEIGNDTSSNFELEIGGDAARINLFNEKNITDLPLIQSGKAYVQSMAGYKSKIEFNNLDLLQSLFIDKAINRATIEFHCDINEDYPSHNKLYLVRETSDGEIVFLSDFTLEGDAHFGGYKTDNIYKFNITRFFFQLIHNQNYTNKLYLLPAGGSTNANRTILNNSETIINIIYSDI